MRNYALPPPAIISLPIDGSMDRFAVRRIYCVGRNYADHVREMGGDPNRSKPIFFTKSRECIIGTGAHIPYPPRTKDLHFEVELVVAMASSTEIFGYAVGLDMTRRDMQAVAKQGGKPWDMAKNFDHSAPCAALVRAKQATHLGQAKISLEKNGTLCQHSSLDKMIWNIKEIIQHLNANVKVCAGDLIFTGTPHGVGPVCAGDIIRGRIDGLPDIEIRYV